MRYQMDSTDAGEMESSAYVALDRDPATNPDIFLDCTDLPSLTRQEFVAESDINNLVAQFEKTGVVSNVNRTEPQYFDTGDVPDLQTAYKIIQDANAAFMRLPASTRLTFDNDPMSFIAFAEQKENLPQMREWGLAPPEAVEPPPTKVEIINQPIPKE
jgi:phage internal scaffolding protein